MNLKKGNRANLNVNKFRVGLGWDPNPRNDEEFDLDVSAFILGDSRKVLFDGTTKGEKYIVYYNSENRILPLKLESNIFEVESYDSDIYPDYEADYREKTRPVSPNFEVIGSLDDTDGTSSDGEDDEDMIIDLNKIDRQAEEIVIVVSIYEAEERNNQNFGQVRNAYIRILDEETNTEILRYDLVEDFSDETALEFGRIYKRNNKWRFEALGNGTSEGLEYYFKTFTSYMD